MSLAAFLILHALATTVFGAALLRCTRPGPLALDESLGPGFLLGYFAETLMAWALMACGLSLGAAATAVVFIALAAAIGAAVGFRGRLIRVPDRHPAWHEWGVLLLLGFEVACAVWICLDAPLIFSDALSAWASRGREIFAGVNFSLVPGRPNFLGYHAPRQYPLGKPLYMALGAFLSGGWNDLTPRFDNVLLLGVSFFTVRFGVLKAGAGRGYASAACFTLLSLPFFFWHAVSGYADTLVGAFAAGGMACLAAGNPLAAGLLASGAAWAKPEGLFIVMPTLFMGLLAMRLRIFLDRKGGMAGAGKDGGMVRVIPFLAGCAAILPWQMFLSQTLGKRTGGMVSPITAVLGIGVLALAFFGLRYFRRTRPGVSDRFRIVAAAFLGGAAVLVAARFQFLEILDRLNLAWQPSAPGILWRMAFVDQTHGLFWGFTLVAVGVSLPVMLRRRAGVLFATCLAGSLILICAVFCLTSASAWLTEPTAVHRLFLQAYPCAVMAAFGGLGMARDPGEG